MPHALLVGKLGAWIVGEHLPCTPAANVAVEEEGRDIDTGVVVAVVAAEVVAGAAAFLEAFEEHVDCKLMDSACMQIH